MNTLQLLVFTLIISVTEIATSTDKLRVLNVFSDSIDLEWDFIANISSYEIATSVQPFVISGAPGKISVSNNKLTVRNLIKPNKYAFRLFSIKSSPCVPTQPSTPITMFDLNNHISLTDVARQVISGFEASAISSQTLKITWDQVNSASHYILTFRPKDSCEPDERVIITSETVVETPAIRENDTANNVTYLFNVRVYNYTSAATTTPPTTVTTTASATTTIVLEPNKLSMDAPKENLMERFYPKAREIEVMLEVPSEKNNSVTPIPSEKNNSVTPIPSEKNNSVTPISSEKNNSVTPKSVLLNVPLIICILVFFFTMIYDF